MIKILRAKLISSIKLYKIFYRKRNESFSYFSEFKEGIIKYLITRQCYYIIKNDLITGLLLFKRKSREIFYIPTAKNNISLFRLIYILNNNFNITGYTLPIRHNKLNPKLYKNYLPVDIVENYKYMCVDTNKCILNSLNINGDVIARRMVIGKEEPIRVKLQNNIFGNIEGRRELTILEVYNEESKNTFLKDMCFILDIDGNPGGYGQILIIDGEYYLVNFGIIKDYRNNGLGLYFLSEIIHNCSLFGIKYLYLCVDNENIPAVKLYEKIGFKELYNKFNVVFK